MSKTYGFTITGFIILDDDEDIEEFSAKELIAESVDFDIEIV